MKTTVPAAVSSRPVKKDDVEFWANKEVVPLLSQARTALNAEYVAPFSVQTDGDGNYVTAWTSDPMPTDSTWLIEARLVANGPAGIIARQVFFRGSGNAAAFGPMATDFSSVYDPSVTAQFIASGQSVALQVKDDGITAALFSGLVRVLSTGEA